MAQINTRIVIRNDSTANWELHNPVLLKGEIGFEFLTTGIVKAKIGDGKTAWNSLGYFEDERIAVLQSMIGTIPEDSEATTLIDYINKKTESLSSNENITNIQNDITNLQTTVGEVPEGKTIMDLINEMTYDDGPIVERIEALEAVGAERNVINSVSEEFAISEDRKLSIDYVNTNKLIQDEGEVLILNGGASI